MKVARILASTAIAGMLVMPCVANAATKYLDFSGSAALFGSTSFGPISGQMILDVVGGVAISGTGFIEGARIPGVETLTLITPSTPGSSGYPSGIGWRDGTGTDTWGWDNLYPIDYVGGLDFSFGAGGTPTQNPAWGHGWQFGIWNNGPTGLGNNYQAWMSGPTNDGPHYYGVTGAIAVSAPEPSTWVMMLIGFAGLGFFCISTTEFGQVSIYGFSR
jgi:PEP-CTERM motif